MGRSFVYVSNEDDWAGLYVDGVLEHEGHINGDYDEGLRRGLKEAGVELEVRMPDLEWLYDVGRLPERLADVQWDAEELVRRGQVEDGPRARQSGLAG